MGLMMVESSAQPSLVARDLGPRLEWRIRNLPYPKVGEGVFPSVFHLVDGVAPCAAHQETYQLSIDDDKQQIVLRTSNKK